MGSARSIGRGLSDPKRWVSEGTSVFTLGAFGNDGYATKLIETPDRQQREETRQQNAYNKQQLDLANQAAADTAAANQRLIEIENQRLADEAAARQAALDEQQRQNAIAQAAAQRQTAITAAQALREQSKSQSRQQRRAGGSLLTGTESGTTKLMKTASTSPTASLASTLGS